MYPIQKCFLNFSELFFVFHVRLRETIFLAVQSGKKDFFVKLKLFSSSWSRLTTSKSTDKELAETKAAGRKGENFLKSAFQPLKRGLLFIKLSC